MDGSPHDWFERRGPRCAPIVFIDGAYVSPLLGADCRFHVMSQLLALRFFAGGGVHGDAARHIAEHGQPVSLYSSRLAKEMRLPGIDDMEAAGAGPSPAAGVQGLPAGTRREPAVSSERDPRFPTAAFEARGIATVEDATRLVRVTASRCGGRRFQAKMKGTSLLCVTAAG